MGFEMLLNIQYRIGTTTAQGLECHWKYIYYRTATTTALEVKGFSGHSLQKRGHQRTWSWVVIVQSRK
jgi:hypothetical protein